MSVSTGPFMYALLLLWTGCCVSVGYGGRGEGRLVPPRHHSDDVVRHFTLQHGGTNREGPWHQMHGRGVLPSRR
jgi:hypothetical protein